MRLSIPIAALLLLGACASAPEGGPARRISVAYDVGTSYEGAVDYLDRTSLRMCAVGYHRIREWSDTKTVTGRFGEIKSSNTYLNWEISCN